MRPIVLFSVAATLAIAGSALAHDHWINSGNFKSPTDGKHCCGPSDCFQVPNERVSVEPNGYRIGDVFVPSSQAMPSRDGQYWQCRKYRCFFVPFST